MIVYAIDAKKSLQLFYSAKGFNRVNKCKHVIGVMKCKLLPLLARRPFTRIVNVDRRVRENNIPNHGNCIENNHNEAKYFEPLLRNDPVKFLSPSS